MRKSLVSLVALGLFLGAPALADTAMAESTSTKATSTQQQSSSPSADQIQELLAGYEERSDIKGHLARAMTIEGNHVLVLVGPENLEADGSVKAGDSDIRDRFQEAGFTGVEILEEARMARAELDEDHYIFALSADQISGSGMQTGGVSGGTGATGSTTMGQTGTQTDTQSGSTTMGQTDTETDTQTGTQSGSTTMGQTDTQTGTQSGSTTMSQTDTQSGSTTMSQADTQTGATTGQSGTQSGTQLGQSTTGTDAQSGSTTMSQTDTQSETTVGHTDSGSETEMDSDAETGQVGRALSEPDAERIVSDLEEAGLEEAKEFKGRLVRATSEEGTPVFFMITSKDMESEAEVDVSEDDIRSKLEEANLEDVEFIDDAKIVRGSLEDDHVFVLAGDLMGNRQ